MRAKLARWGDSLAVCLPAEMVRAFDLDDGQSVEISARERVIEIIPERSRIGGIPVYDLDELLAEIDRLGPENAPESVDWGRDRGAEIIDDAYSRGEIVPGGVPCGVDRAERG